MKAEEVSWLDSGTIQCHHGGYLRIAGWLAPLTRCRARLQELRPRLLALQLGGASGT